MPWWKNENASNLMKNMNYFLMITTLFPCIVINKEHQILMKNLHLSIFKRLKNAMVHNILFVDNSLDKTNSWVTPVVWEYALMQINSGMWCGISSPNVHVLKFSWVYHGGGLGLHMFKLFLDSFSLLSRKQNLYLWLWYLNFYIFP